jgi:hypothetical protein
MKSSFLMLTELSPELELFRLPNLSSLRLYFNKLCSLPRAIAHLTRLKLLDVRSVAKGRMTDRNLTLSRAFRFATTSSRRFLRRSAS